MAKYPDYSDWKVQLAYPYTGKELRDGEKFWLSAKLNGVRATFFNNELVSRSGIIFKGLEYINNMLSKIQTELAAQPITEDDGYYLYLDDEYVFDGELVLAPVFHVGDNNANFRKANGIANSTVDMSEKYKLVYMIFDVIPRYDFVEELPENLKYSARRKVLDKISEIMYHDASIKGVYVLGSIYEGDDTSQIDHWSARAVENDIEGIMINRDDYYVFRRTKSLLKVKQFSSIDLEIVGFELGDKGKQFENTLGRIVCKYKDNFVSVGSGFTNEQRDAIWNDRFDLIGKIIEVKYKSVTRDKSTGLESLEYPVFIDFRPDKTEADA